MDSLIKFQPRTLTFAITLNLQTASTLVVENITDEPLALKVKTTHVHRYSVRPKAAIIAPHQTLRVRILQQAFEAPPDDFNNCSDRFQLLAVSLSKVPEGPLGECHGYPNVVALWSAASSDDIAKAHLPVKMRLAELHTDTEDPYADGFAIKRVESIPDREPSDDPDPSSRLSRSIAVSEKSNQPTYTERFTSAVDSDPLPGRPNHMLDSLPRAADVLHHNGTRPDDVTDVIVEVESEKTFKDAPVDLSAASTLSRPEAKAPAKMSFPTLQALRALREKTEAKAAASTSVTSNESLGNTNAAKAATSTSGLATMLNPKVSSISVASLSAPDALPWPMASGLMLDDDADDDGNNGDEDMPGVGDDDDGGEKAVANGEASGRHFEVPSAARDASNGAMVTSRAAGHVAAVDGAAHQVINEALSIETRPPQSEQSSGAPGISLEPTNVASKALERLIPPKRPPPTKPPAVNNRVPDKATASNPEVAPREAPVSMGLAAPTEAAAPVEPPALAEESAPAPVQAPTPNETPTPVAAPAPVEAPTSVKAPTLVEAPTPDAAPALVEAQAPVEGPTPVADPARVEVEASAPVKAAAPDGAPSSSKAETGPPESKPEPPKEEKIDYKSREFTRTRVVEMHTGYNVEIPDLERSRRQRVAVERAGELVRVINDKLLQIEEIDQQLVEARHRLGDARLATRPAYDVTYEISETSGAPLIQVCVMAVISGALLQLLV